MEDKPIFSADNENEKQTQSEYSCLDALGEMTLREAIKNLWKWCINIKLKYIGSSLVVIFSGVCVFFLVVEFSSLFFKAIQEPFSLLSSGEHIIHTSNQFKQYLYSLPLSICSGLVVGRSFKKHKFLWGVIYFAILQAILLIWDSWNISEIGIGKIYGIICFIIIFVLIPALSYILHKSE